MQFIVVRHSERIDEADKEGWKAYYTDLFDQVPCPVSRSKKCFASDPPMTEKGVIYATQAGQLVWRIIGNAQAHARSKSPPGRIQLRVYCSKMKRCVQTAVTMVRAIKENAALAEKVGVEPNSSGKVGEDGEETKVNDVNTHMQEDICLFLSSGLSSVIQVVAKARGAFEFMTPDELQHVCEGMTYVDCDVRHTPYTLPCDHYVHTIQTILERPPLPLPVPSVANVASTDTAPVMTLHILVAHRETIRGLVGFNGGLPHPSPLPTPIIPAPYCCVGVYEARRDNNSLQLPKIGNKAGKTEKTEKLSLQRGSSAGKRKEEDGVKFMLNCLWSCRGEQIYPMTSTSSSSGNAQSSRSAQSSSQKKPVAPGAKKK
eukprot:gene37046-44960_t